MSQWSWQTLNWLYDMWWKHHYQISFDYWNKFFSASYNFIPNKSLYIDESNSPLKQEVFKVFPAYTAWHAHGR